MIVRLNRCQRKQKGEGKQNKNEKHNTTQKTKMMRNTDTTNKKPG